MERNNLYPVFLKLSSLRVLIVGGGYVAEEKLHFLLKSSPDANVKMVATFFREGTARLAGEYKIELVERAYRENDLTGHQMVIVATDNEALNGDIYHQCKAHNILVNVADNPPFCDFYMGGIVTKGNVKIAISTNGKSPTTAKRLRQFFEEVIPEKVDEMVINLDAYRKTLKGDFEQKMEKLNELTKGLIDKY
ncbi:MAG: bifunctional precorrin-2 dehydrogenase/sirohydrochlorin ferrochelatase [Ekhidna sp.]|nr:bifunctional precorrin-2 dehydrogenase/sirohydrochlorin ferrochelatase [Ekhidna sp.]MBC6411025.1 bifunctional precorrin-2 dehydrogenase/sirohydrochlorin ferrochelatase [Ekhidna sp.]